MATYVYIEWNYQSLFSSAFCATAASQALVFSLGILAIVSVLPRTFILSLRKNGTENSEQYCFTNAKRMLL